MLPSCRPARANGAVDWPQGGPAGTVAINETHHETPDGDVIEVIQSVDDESGLITINTTHHIDAAGEVTSHVEGNLTREFHGLTDEHLDNHTAAGSTHDLVHLYNPGLADSSWFGMVEPEMEPEPVRPMATVALNDTHHLAGGNGSSSNDCANVPTGNASVNLCGTCVAPGAESDCSVDCSGVFTATGAAGRKQTVELAIGETVTLLHCLPS